MKKQLKQQRSTRGNLIEEEDLTDAVTDIIVKTDTTTAAKMIEEINEIDTETIYH